MTMGEVWRSGSPLGRAIARPRTRAHDPSPPSTTRMRLSTPFARLVSSVVAALALASCAHPSQSASTAPDRGSYDVVIENGRIVDGTGNPWTYGDIGIRGDRIVA